MKYCVLALAAACGGATDLSTNNSQQCSATLSGSLTGTTKCNSNMVGGYDPSKNTAGLGVSTGTPYVVVAIGYTGDWHTGTYTQANSVPNGGSSGITAQPSNASTQIWAAIAGSSNASDNQGSWTLNITDTGPVVTGTNGQKAYTSMHGSLDGTL